MGRGILLSLLGGTAAAGLWAMIASLTGYEAGIVAWIVGLLAGIGMMAGRGKGAVRSRGAGMAAAAVAVLAILGGKFAAVHLLVQETLNSEAYSLADARAALEWETYERMEREGRPLTETDDGVPREVQLEANRAWTAMTQREREQYFTDHAALDAQERAEAQPVLTVLAFLFSFGLFDLLWVGLAVSTAYRSGSAGLPPTASEEAAADEAPVSGAAFWRPMAESEAPRSLPFSTKSDESGPAADVARRDAA